MTKEGRHEPARPSRQNNQTVQKKEKTKGSKWTMKKNQYGIIKRKKEINKRVNKNVGHTGEICTAVARGRCFLKSLTEEKEAL